MPTMGMVPKSLLGLLLSSLSFIVALGIGSDGFRRSLGIGHIKKTQKNQGLVEARPRARILRSPREE